jgi:callose synthase
LGAIYVGPEYVLWSSFSAEAFLVQGSDDCIVVQVVDALQNLYEALVRDFPADDSVLQMDHLSVTREEPDTQLFMEAVELPAIGDDKFFKNLKRLHTTLTTKDPLLDVPKGLEARRRISFFSNSLFMTMPRAPLVFLSP